MIFTNKKSDKIGALASILCLIHCIITPFIFIVQSSSVACCSSTTPTWWSYIDYIFLIVSFFAIYYAAKTSTSKWMKPSLWISWLLLVLIIINEKAQWISLNKHLIYIPAIALIVLHLYNNKYYQRKTDKCNINEG